MGLVKVMFQIREEISKIFNQRRFTIITTFFKSIWTPRRTEKGRGWIMRSRTIRRSHFVILSTLLILPQTLFHRIIHTPLNHFIFLAESSKIFLNKLLRTLLRTHSTVNSFVSLFTSLNINHSTLFTLV